MRVLFIRASAVSAVLVLASWATTSDAQSNPYEELDDGEELKIGEPAPEAPATTTPVTVAPATAGPVTVSPAATPVYVPIYVQPIYVPPTASPRLGDAPRVIDPPPPLVFTPDRSLLREETRPNGSVIAAGLVIFGIPYAASLASYGASKHPGDDSLWVPVAGPWLDLADRGGLPTARPQREEELSNRALLVTDGLFQALGAVAVVGAFIFPELRTKQLGDETAKPHLRMTPMKLGKLSYGVGAVGTF
jgi:hypothetical protein